MNTPEFIESPDTGKHVFTPDEVRLCTREWVCVGCGLCCIVPSMSIPKREPVDALDPMIDTEMKDPLEPCKYLEETHEGIFRCGIHGKKRHPLLHSCATWNGYGVDRKGHIAKEALLAYLAEVETKYPNPERLAILAKLRARGLMP